MAYTSIIINIIIIIIIITSTAPMAPDIIGTALELAAGTVLLVETILVLLPVLPVGVVVDAKLLINVDVMSIAIINYDDYSYT